MNFKHLKLQLALVLLLTQWSCRVNQQEVVNPVSPSISIEEARVWHEKRSPANARSSSQNSSELAFWKYAFEGKLANGVNIVTVPLVYNNFSPVSVSNDENIVKKDSTYSITGFEHEEHLIQKKLLISKDEQGNLRSVTITVIPDKQTQRSKQTVKGKNFSGVVLFMNNKGDDFEVGFRYKKGEAVDVFYPRAQSPNGRLSSYSCRIGIYQKAASGSPGGWSCSSGERTCIPSAFMDNGSFYVLLAAFDATCDDGLPNGIKTRENPWDSDDDVSWVMPNYGGGASGPVVYDPFGRDATESPIDHGQPIELDGVDAYAWQLANRIGGGIFLTEDEIQIIRNYWDITYYITAQVQETGSKPVISLSPNEEATDIISLYGGIEPYEGPDPSVCNECTESSPPHYPLFAPRSAFPPGYWGDLFYKIDRNMVISGLFPGIGALRAPGAIFRAGTFRASLAALRPPPAGLFDAHHILPQAQKYTQYFTSRGINIHNPRFGFWWTRGPHQHHAAAYNRAWDQFIQNNPNATVDEIIAFGKQLMSQYGFDVFWL